MDGQPASDPPGAAPHPHHPAASGPDAPPDAALNAPPSGPPYPPYPPYQPYQYGAPAPGYYQPPRSPQERRGGVPWWVWLLSVIGVLALLVVGSCVALGFAAGQFASRIANQITNTTSVSTTVSKSFTVTGTPHVTVRNVAGNITILTGNAGNVSIQAVETASDQSTSQAESDLGQLSVDMTQSGSEIEVTVQDVDQGSLPPFARLEVAITIYVPEQTNLELHAPTGDESVTGVQGVVNVESATGDVEMSGVTLANTSDMTLVTGTLTFDGALAKGASVTMTISTGDAQVMLPETTQAHLRATTSVGDIFINGWDIPVSRSGAGASATGDMAASASPRGTLRIQVSTGDIDLESRVS